MDDAPVDRGLLRLFLDGGFRGGRAARRSLGRGRFCWLFLWCCRWFFFWLSGFCWGFWSFFFDITGDWDLGVVIQEVFEAEQVSRILDGGDCFIRVSSGSGGYHNSQEQGREKD